MPYKTVAKSIHQQQSTLHFLHLAFFMLLAAFVGQDAHADENLFAKHYKAQNVYALKSMQASPDTKMYVSQDKKSDNISMLEDGYDMMGSSGFKHGDIAPDLARAHAQSIQADVVLVYTKHASKPTGASRMAMIKEAAKTGVTLTEADVAEPKEEYRYYASYWAKIPMPLFGVHFIKLKTKQAKNTPKGLQVLAVIKGSSAAKAGLQRGDVLLQLDNQTLEQPQALGQIVRANENKTVDMVYMRNEQTMTAKVHLAR